MWPDCPRICPRLAGAADVNAVMAMDVVDQLLPAVGSGQDGVGTKPYPRGSD